MVGFVETGVQQPNGAGSAKRRRTLVVSRARSLS
jgi:hypothetical protein